MRVTPPMNPDVKALWLDALRDPARTQGKHVLKNEDGEECCLGVLCDVAVREGVIPPATLDKNCMGESAYFFGAERNYTALPEEIMKWADLSYCFPRIDLGRGLFLSDANDRDDYTFEEIATLIEEHL